MLSKLIGILLGVLLAYIVTKIANPDFDFSAVMDNWKTFTER